jgi:hypothetical protein
MPVTSEEIMGRSGPSVTFCACLRWHQIRRQCPVARRFEQPPHIPYLNSDNPTASAPMLTIICARNRAKPVPSARNVDVDTAEYSPDMHPIASPNATTENAFSTVSVTGNVRDKHPSPHRYATKKYFQFQRSISVLIKMGNAISQPSRIHPRVIVLAAESGPKFGCVHHT